MKIVLNVTPDKGDEEFWDAESENTPEARVAAHKRMQQAREKAVCMQIAPSATLTITRTLALHWTPASPSASATSSLVRHTVCGDSIDRTADGRPLNMNEGGWDFSMIGYEAHDPVCCLNDIAGH